MRSRAQLAQVVVTKPAEHPSSHLRPRHMLSTQHQLAIWHPPATWKQLDTGALFSHTGLWYRRGIGMRKTVKMLKFYYNLSPNPSKVALFLEETATPYEPIPVDTRTGGQHAPSFLAVNPNGKVPAIDDGGQIVFDSNAILLYLAEKTGQFLPAPAHRGEFLSWHMFVATGLGPFSGQAVHFQHFAPEDVPYAKTRYTYEAERHYGVLNDHLATRDFMVGNAYSIVDMNVWGWARMIPFVLGPDAFAKFPAVKRLVDTISARPAAQRVAALKDKFAFKAEMDKEARNHMFKHLAPS